VENSGCLSNVRADNTLCNQCVLNVYLNILTTVLYIKGEMGMTVNSLIIFTSSIEMATWSTARTSCSIVPHIILMIPARSLLYSVFRCNHMSLAIDESSVCVRRKRKRTSARKSSCDIQ
jgi:hypothetical protein